MDQQASELFGGQIELGECCFSGARKGKRGRVAVFGILKQDGKVYTVIVEKTKTENLKHYVCGVKFRTYLLRIPNYNVCPFRQTFQFYNNSLINQTEKFNLELNFSEMVGYFLF